MHFVLSILSYNRIVVHGETFVREIVPLSAKPFNFQTEYRLTEEQVTGCVCATNWTKPVKRQISICSVDVCWCLQTVSALVPAQALEVSDHYPVEVLLKVIKSKVPFNGATSLALTGTEETTNQFTSHSKFLSLFVLSHYVFQMLTW